MVGYARIDGCRRPDALGRANPPYDSLRPARCVRGRRRVGSRGPESSGLVDARDPRVTHRLPNRPWWVTRGSTAAGDLMRSAALTHPTAHSAPQDASPDAVGWGSAGRKTPGW